MGTNDHWLGSSRAGQVVVAPLLPGVRWGWATGWQDLHPLGSPAAPWLRGADGTWTPGHGESG